MKHLLSKVKNRYLLLAILVSLFAIDMSDGELDSADLIIDVLTSDVVDQPELEAVDEGTGEGTGAE